MDDPQRWSVALTVGLALWRCSVLAEAMQLPDYKGDARSAIQLDFCSYNLSFAQQAGFSATQTSAVVTLALDVLAAIADGANAEHLKESFKTSLVPLLSVKSAELASYRCVAATKLGEACAALLWKGLTWRGACRAYSSALTTHPPHTVKDEYITTCCSWLGSCGGGGGAATVRRMKSSWRRCRRR
jgi:hypothetical protein